jgi:hypothetical protein
MTPARQRCYAAFIDRKPDLRTVRETAPMARTAGQLWHPGKRFTVRVVNMTWRRA